MKSESLQELYVDELKCLYSTKAQLISALPKMANAAQSPLVRTELKEELDLARDHLARLELILESLKESPRGSQGQEVEGMLSKGKMAMIHNAPSPSIDTALIAATQRVVRDAIAGYSCVRTYARLLYFDDAALVLQDSLNDEGAADDRLRQLARGAYKIGFNALDASA